MKLRVLVHKAEGGRLWAEVPALPGCFSEADTMQEMLTNIREAIACHLDAPAPSVPVDAELVEVEV
jgi:predicted RNase H-like HicB family nuclease